MPIFRLPSWTLSLACVLITAGLLAVGLWPFDPFPKNEAAWLPDGKGVRFGGYGLSFTPDPVLHDRQHLADSFCSLRVRLQPTFAYFNNAGTILDFYTPENPSRFRLMQYGDELLIRKDYLNEKNRFQTIELELERVFLKIEPVTFIITSGSAGTVAYRNGVEAGVSNHMKFSCADLAGQLVIGDSPVTHDSWPGSIMDLTIYDSVLPPQQVSQESFQLKQSASPTSVVSPNVKMIARYAFNDGSGKLVRNVAGTAPDLYIPDRYRTLHRVFLVWPWRETSDKLEFRDIAINILGFVPFGLLLSAHLLINRASKRAVLFTVMAGFSISLTIEVLQAYIPSRGSGILDVVTNTFGTYLGALLFQSPAIKNLATSLFFRPGREETAR